MIDPEFIHTIYKETADLLTEGEVNEYETRTENAIIVRIRLASALK